MTGSILAYDEAVHIPAGVDDLESFRQWVHSDDFPEQWKVTFVKGEIIIDMSPQEIPTHSWVRRDVQGVLWNYVNTNNLGHLHPDGTMLVNEAANLSTEPDLMFCNWDSLQSSRVSYRESVDGSERLVEVNGSPDLVLEVVSRSSVRKDTHILRKRYFEAGVREYWLIDARGCDLDFQLLVRGDTEYVAIEPDADGFRASPVFGCSFLLTRETDQIGAARYHLEIRLPD